MDSILGKPADTPAPLHLPLLLARVPAGFPSPAADYLEQRIDLNEQLIHDAVATFFIRASGESMKDAGILDGTVLVVNAARPPMPGDIVVASVDGKHTVKRLMKIHGRFELHPDNASGKYPVIIPDSSLQIFGVVTSHIVEHHQKVGRR